MSSQTFAKGDLVEQTSFKADHTIYICLHTFCSDVLIRLLVIISFTKLKSSFPSTFKRAVGGSDVRRC